MKLTNEHKARLFDAMSADGVDNWEGYQGENYQKVMEQIETEEESKKIKDSLGELFEIISLHCDVDYPAGREAGSSVTVTDEGEEEIAKFISRNFTLK
jgi:hypothetical protein